MTKLENSKNKNPEHKLTLRNIHDYSTDQPAFTYEEGLKLLLQTNYEKTTIETEIDSFFLKYLPKYNVGLSVDTLPPVGDSQKNKSFGPAKIIERKFSLKDKGLEPLPNNDNKS